MVATDIRSRRRCSGRSSSRSGCVQCAAPHALVAGYGSGGIASRSFGAGVGRVGVQDLSEGYEGSRSVVSNAGDVRAEETLSSRLPCYYACADCHTAGITPRNSFSA